MAIAEVREGSEMEYIYIYVFMYVYIYLKSTNGFRCGTINSKEVINFKRAIGLNQSHQYL